MAYTEPVKFSETGTYGCGTEDEDDVYTVEEFVQCVKCGGFTDYDGFGHPVKDRMADWCIFIHPSDTPKCIPEDATYIVWYNK